MDRSTLTRTGIAGAVAGLGLAVGGIAVASADTASPDSSTSGDARPGGPRGGHGPDAAVIAKALGLDEDVVAAALDKVRDDLRPAKPTDGTKPTPPTDAERATRRAALAKALAAELDVSQAQVEAALEKAEAQEDADRAERRAEGRADLVTRLDAAVKAGTLTSADKASVLKAFDADLIGGGGHVGPGGPPGGAREGSAS